MKLSDFYFLLLFPCAVISKISTGSTLKNHFFLLSLYKIEKRNIPMGIAMKSIS